MALAADCSRREQRDGGGGETDRLLVEELKCELSQTKLELETSLKSQHKHLKELDTLRLEMFDTWIKSFFGINSLISLDIDIKNILIYVNKLIRGTHILLSHYCHLLVKVNYPQFFL